MGQSASKVGGKSKGIVVTLDALGTIYKFKKPVATQYLEVARRAGVTQDIQVDQLQRAFKDAYKEQVSKHPNYGHGSPLSPREWWMDLVGKTFSPFVKDVPNALPEQVYDHFSSAEAYELQPDVQPFLQSIHNLRNQLSESQGPSVLTGVITNSDPRVSRILVDLSLKVGEVKIPTNDEIRDSATASAMSGQLQTPWSNAYDPGNDFDFLVTGFEAGAEKPDSKIWRYADFQASLVAISKSQKGMVLPEGRVRGALAVVANAVGNLGSTDNMQWIHIGDEYEKDYVGAISAGREALLLDREGRLTVEADKITSLEEAATVVNLMAQEILKQRAA